MKPNACKTRTLVAWLVMGAWLAGNVGWLSYGNSLGGFDGLSVYVFAGPSALGQSLWMMAWAIIADETRRMRIAGAVAGLSLAMFLVGSINAEIEFAAAMASCLLIVLTPAYWTWSRGWRLSLVSRDEEKRRDLRVRLLDLFVITTLVAVWLGLAGMMDPSDLLDYALFSGSLGPPVAIVLLLAFGAPWRAMVVGALAVVAAAVVAAAYFHWIDLSGLGFPFGLYSVLGLIEFVAVAAVALALRGCGYRWRRKQTETAATDL